MAVSAMSKQQVFVVYRLPFIKSIGAVLVNHHIVLHPLCKDVRNMHIPIVSLQGHSVGFISSLA